MKVFSCISCTRIAAPAMMAEAALVARKSLVYLSLTVPGGCEAARPPAVYTYRPQP